MSNILLMPFLDESHSFCHGYECGKIFQQMEQGDTFEKYTMHTDNVEQVKLICDYHGYEYSFETYDDTWSYLFAKPVDISTLKT